MIDVDKINLNDRSVASLKRLLESAKTSNYPDNEKDRLIMIIEAKLGIGNDYKALMKDIDAGMADIDDLKV